MRAIHIRYNCYGTFEPRFSNSGSRKKMTYGVDIDPRGDLKLYEKGEVDVYEQIQSFRNGVDIHDIVARYNMTGDPSILNIDWSLFGGDARGVPTDIRSAYTVVKEAEKVYKSLKPELASKYSSFADFLKDVHNFNPSSKKASAAVNDSVSKEAITNAAT